MPHIVLRVGGGEQEQTGRNEEQRRRNFMMTRPFREDWDILYVPLDGWDRFAQEPMEDLVRSGREKGKGKALNLSTETKSVESLALPQNPLTEGRFDLTKALRLVRWARTLYVVVEVLPDARLLDPAEGR